MTLFHSALALTPLWSVALFFGLGGWLLHPFRLRHLFDRRLPGSLRGALAAVALTSAIPLGGLAIPFWIYAHYRLWPRYEPLLWSLDKKDSPARRNPSSRFDLVHSRFSNPLPDLCPSPFLASI